MIMTWLWQDSRFQDLVLALETLFQKIGGGSCIQVLIIAWFRLIEEKKELVGEVLGGLQMYGFF